MQLYGGSFQAAEKYSAARPEKLASFVLEDLRPVLADRDPADGNPGSLLDFRKEPAGFPGKILGRGGLCQIAAPALHFLVHGPALGEGVNARRKIRDRAGADLVGGPQL